ncbi:MAG: serine/threonine protein kinase [Bacteroidales bacterium]|nr:serine/threonine protein kinase [Bacteroidales bacterium]
MEQTSDSGFVGKPFVDKSTNEFTDYVEMPCGGFNRLFRAKRYGKWFVLKGLKLEYSSNPFYRELLGKEFELGMMLSHPNIVTIHGREYDAVLGDCIVMEYVDGMALMDFLDSKPSAEAVRKIVDEILSAMSYFHGLQVVHRDIKPSNILITRNGNNVKIIDFGFSDTDSHAILKQPAGTARYAAPEQYDENVAIDCRADIYSFGMVLKDIVSATKIGGSKAVVRKCTQYDREKRYANAAEIQKAIAFHRRARILVPVVVFMVAVLTVVAFWVRNDKNVSSDVPNIISDTIVKIDTIFSEINDTSLADSVVAQRVVMDGNTDYSQSLFDEAKLQIDALSAAINAELASDTLLTQQYLYTYLTKYYYLSQKKCDSIALQLPEGSVLQSQFVSHWDALYKRSFENIHEKFKSCPNLYDLYQSGKITREFYLEKSKQNFRMQYEIGLITKDQYEEMLMQIDLY